MISVAFRLDIIWDVALIITRISGLSVKAVIDSDIDLKMTDEDLMKSAFNNDKAFHKECYFNDELISFKDLLEVSNFDQEPII